MSILLQLLIGLEPQIPKIISDFRAIFAKHPTLSPEALAAAIVQISTATDAEADAILAKAAADTVSVAPKP